MTILTCLCGFKERDMEYVKVPVLYVRGPKKGQFKRYVEKIVDGERMEEFTIGNWEFKACPRCGLVYKDGYY